MVHLTESQRRYSIEQLGVIMQRLLELHSEGQLGPPNRIGTVELHYYVDVNALAVVGALNTNPHIGTTNSGFT